MAQPLDQSINSLEQFREVAILNPAVGDVLQYNGWEWRNAAASAGSGPTTKRVASDVESASSEQVVISDWTSSLAANKKYAFSGTAVFTGDTFSPGITVAGPSGATGYVAFASVSPTISILCTINGSQANASSSLPSPVVMCVYGFVATSAAGGNLTFSMIESSSEGPGLFIKAGSCLLITEIS